MMTERTKRLEVRLTPREQNKVERLAERCGLSISEYVRQRCLGYAPRELPTEDLYWLCDYLRDCADPSNEMERESTQALVDDIRTMLILPGRDL